MSPPALATSGLDYARANLELPQCRQGLVLAPLADGGIRDPEQAGELGIVLGPEQFTGAALGDGLVHARDFTRLKPKVKSAKPVIPAASDGRSVSCLMDANSLGARLAEALADANMKPAELARLSKNTDATIYNWMSGTALVEHVKAANLFRIAKVLRVRPEWLLLGEGPKPATASPVQTASDPSHPVKPAVLASALQLVGSILQESELPMTPEKQARLVMLVYDLLEEGIPEAKVLRFAREAA